ncbi:hypothetical protein BJF93_12970 [Xaviernesmea oryzae]|uniref:Uncharacterized protein n=2 Tax=Xaviernesmea oryzae TaxID=464029 RepID=A0A1Q9ARD2_9HYPH|nr:hypothetical protein BJF93_12970 [Xaviernesmea oryzae]
MVVRGRLWRLANPHLAEGERQSLVRQLMAGRRAVKDAVDADQRVKARQQVNDTKIALGERGPVWWSDGTPDYNRRFAKNTPYADWFAQWQESARR